MKTNLAALRRITFLALALTASTALLADGDKSNKTFLSPRSPSVNMAHKYTTWADYVYPRRCDKIHTSFQLTGFYSASEKSKDLGNYFGIGNNSNSFTVGDKTAAPPVEINSNFLIHDSVEGGANASGTITLAPRQEVLGARLDFFQDLHFRFAKFFIAATLPIVHVQQNMRITEADATKFRDVTPAEFLSGATPSAHPGRPERNLQDPLTHAKIGGSHSETGVADIEVQLGWKAFESKKCHAFVNLGFTIPTSNKATGEFLFEPIYGNGNHFALGGGIDAGMTLWCKDKNKVRLLLAGDYRFLFDNTQKRTIGVLKSTGDIDPFQQYSLAFKVGQPINTALFPAANVLTRSVRVEPGSQIDMLAALSFNFCRLTFDAGYNLFWRDKESVKIKNWDDNTYFIAAPDKRTNELFIADENDLSLNAADLNVAAAATPSLLSHKIFGSLAYSGKIKDKYPCSFGVGGSYEFADTNADLENWST